MSPEGASADGVAGTGGGGEAATAWQRSTLNIRSSSTDHAFPVDAGAQLERQALWTLHWNMVLPITATIYSTSLQGSPLSNLTGWLLLPIYNKEMEAQRGQATCPITQ